eukprot:876477-Pelagomonas_calceolata.AAC.2
MTHTSGLAMPACRTDTCKSLLVLATASSETKTRGLNARKTRPTCKMTYVKLVGWALRWDAKTYQAYMQNDMREAGGMGLAMRCKDTPIHNKRVPNM